MFVHCVHTEEVACVPAHVEAIRVYGREGCMQNGAARVLALHDCMCAHAGL